MVRVMAAIMITMTIITLRLQMLVAMAVGGGGGHRHGLGHGHIYGGRVSDDGDDDNDGAHMVVMGGGDLALFITRMTMAIETWMADAMRRRVLAMLLLRAGSHQIQIPAASPYRPDLPMLFVAFDAPCRCSAG